MANFIPMIGLDPAELVSVRTLVYLLRHPDPVVPELTLQALSYLEARASEIGIGPPDLPSLDQNSEQPAPEVYRRRIGVAGLRYLQCSHGGLNEGP